MDVQIILPPRDRDFLSESLRLLTKTICEAHPEIEGGYGLGGEHGYGENFENDVFVMRRFYWGDCDCGWMEKEDAWSDGHAHSDDCYWNVSRRLIETSEFAKAREDALAERSRHPWGSPAEERAQKAVNTACDALRDYETAVRKRLCAEHGIPWENGSGSAVHCTCDHDRLWKEFLKENPGHLPTCSLELPNFKHKASGFEVRWYKWIGRDNELKNEPSDIGAVLTECIASVRHPPAPPDRSVDSASR